jgi:hypothetical protein
MGRDLAKTQQYVSNKRNESNNRGDMVGQAKQRGSREERIAAARFQYDMKRYAGRAMICDYPFPAGVPTGVLDFIKHPKPWNVVLQRPYNLDEILQRHAKGDYGRVRFPEIFVRKSGTALFGVGSQYWSHSHKSSFRGCLIHILQEEIGVDFFEKQRQVEPDRQHPLAVWNFAAEAWSERHSDSASIPEIGASASFTMLAYHIYLLKENGNIPQAVLDRLRHADQFQGARYEIYVAAMMIVCGYHIEWLPHSDETSVEFVATHPNGTKFAVEAKSKHRLGVLKPGVVDRPDDPDRIDFQANIFAGLRKDPELPLLLFVDANVPFTLDEMKPAMLHEIERAWTKRVDRNNQKQWVDGFPCVGLIVTNDTVNWQIPVEIDLGRQLGWAWSSAGPNRHGLDATLYLDEIRVNGGKANIVPNILWKNTNPPQAVTDSSQRFVPLLD